MVLFLTKEQAVKEHLTKEEADITCKEYTEQNEDSMYRWYYVAEQTKILY